MAVTRQIIDRGHFGEFTSATELPNVLGSPNQVDNLRAGDVATVGGQLYSCLTDTKGAAMWGPDAAVGGASANTYSHSGTYTPTVTTNGSATVAPALLSGYSRVGNGAGVPLAGDTVTVFGAFTAGGLADGDVVLVSLPFQIAENVYPWCEWTVIPYLGPGIDVTSASFSGPDGAFYFTMGVSGLGDGGVSFTFTYQTANAVDP